MMYVSFIMYYSITNFYEEIDVCYMLEKDINVQNCHPQFSMIVQINDILKIAPGLLVFFSIKL